MHGLTGLAHQRRAAVHLLHGGIDQLLDLLGRRGAALRQRAHLARHHGKAAALFAGTRRFHRGVQREDVGLEGNALDHFDDVGDLARAGADRRHGLDHVADHLAAALGDAGCGFREAVGRARAFGVLAHHRRQLAHAGRGLLQRGGLFLGALRQVGIACGDLVRGCADGIGGGLDARHQVGEHVFHLAQPAQQPAEFAAALGLEILAQVAGGHRFGDVDRFGQWRLDAARQCPGGRHRHSQSGHAERHQQVARVAVAGTLHARQCDRDGHRRQCPHGAKRRAKPYPYPQVLHVSSVPQLSKSAVMAPRRCRPAGTHA
ncbi:hypothetical protein D9M68_408540 [compost metagenome]